MSKVEAVALAIQKKNPDRNDDWPLNEDDLDMARAAIGNMRTPSEAMRAAWYRVFPWSDAAYSTMMDAALEE